MENFKIITESLDNDQDITHDETTDDIKVIKGKHLFM